MSQPQISKAACQDLDAIAEYFLTRNIDTGERFFQEFNQKCKHLIKFPLMGVAKALIQIELKSDLKALLEELYSQPPIDEITDNEIMNEIKAVRQRIYIPSNY